MKTETIHLSQIQVNGANPRTIKNDKFEKLIRSILILPKMLEPVSYTHLTLPTN